MKERAPVVCVVDADAVARSSLRLLPKSLKLEAEPKRAEIHRASQPTSRQQRSYQAEGSIMRSIRRILIAIKDFEAKTTPALVKGAQLARALGARVELFHGYTQLTIRTSA